MLIRSLVISLVAASTSALGADAEIPRSVSGDKGRYYLLENKKVGSINTTFHKRVGPSGTTHTKSEINCASKQMRVISEGEEDPGKMIVMPTKWFDLVEGSSKSDLFNYVCRK